MSTLLAIDKALEDFALDHDWPGTRPLASASLIGEGCIVLRMVFGRYETRKLIAIIEFRALREPEAIVKNYLKDMLDELGKKEAQEIRERG